MVKMTKKVNCIEKFKKNKLLGNFKKLKKILKNFFEALIQGAKKPVKSRVFKKTKKNKKKLKKVLTFG